MTTQPNNPEAITFRILESEHEALQVLNRIFGMREGSIKEQQMVKFLRLCRDSFSPEEMTQERLLIYEQHRQREHNAKDWWLECDLNFFLKNWRKIWLIVHADDAVLSAYSDTQFRAACLAYSRPDQWLNLHIRRAAEHLSGTAFVRPTAEPVGWLLGPDQICDPASQDALYLANLRNPAVWQCWPSARPGSDRSGR